MLRQVRHHVNRGRFRLCNELPDHNTFEQIMAWTQQKSSSNARSHLSPSHSVIILIISYIHDSYWPSSSTGSALKIAGKLYILVESHRLLSDEQRDKNALLTVDFLHFSRDFHNLSAYLHHHLTFFFSLTGWAPHTGILPAQIFPTIAFLHCHLLSLVYCDIHPLAFSFSGLDEFLFQVWLCYLFFLLWNVKWNVLFGNACVMSHHMPRNDSDRESYRR